MELSLRILVEHVADDELWVATLFYEHERIADYSHSARGRAIGLARQAAAEWLVEQNINASIQVLDLVELWEE